MIELETINQANFRILLNCMSFPGTINTLEGSLEYQPNTLAPVFLCAQLLLDSEVSFWTFGEKNDIIEKEIAFITKSNVSNNENADYLFLSTNDCFQAIIRAKRGSLESPEQGATCVLYTPEMTQEASSFFLKGPGIEDYCTFPTMIDFDGDEFYNVLNEVNKEPPTGIDFIFIDQQLHVFCVPRSVKMKRGE